MSQAPGTRSGLSYAVVNFGSVLVVSLFSTLALSRLYGVHVIGEFALVAAPYTLVYMISSVNERAGLIRTLSTTPRNSPRVAPLFWNVFAFSLTLTLVIAAVMAVWSVLYLRHIGQALLVLPMLTVLGAYVLVENTSWNLDSLLSAYRLGQSLFIARFGQAVILLVVSAVMRTMTDGVWGLVIGLLAGFAFGLSARLVLVGRGGSLRTTTAELRAELSALRGFVIFGLRLTPATVVNSFSLQAPVWVLGGMLDVASVGAWSRGYGLAQRLQELSYRFNEIMMPTLAARTGDTHSFGRSLGKGVRGLVPLMAMFVFVGAGASEGIMSLFGPGFSEATHALQLLLVMFGMLGVTSAFGSALIAAGLPNAVNSAVALRAILMLVLLWPLTKWAGLTGAAAALLLSAVAPVIVQLSALHRRGFLAGFQRSGLIHLGLAVIGAGVVGFATSWGIQHYWTGFVAVIMSLVVGCAGYIAALALLGGVRVLDQHLLEGRLSARFSRTAALFPRPW